MHFDIEIAGRPVRVDILTRSTPEQIRYRYDGNTYNSYDEVEAAIKAASLAERKGFTNPTAYRIDWRADRLRTLTVTSICEDGMNAWCRSEKGERTKESLSNLLADEAEAREALDEYARLHMRSLLICDSVRRWEPQWPSKAGAEVEVVVEEEEVQS